MTDSGELTGRLPPPDPPFDYELMQKGDFLSRETLLTHLPELASLDPKQYDLFLLGERQKIEVVFFNRGEPTCIKSTNGGLRALTDAEATIYLEKEQRRHRKGLKKGYMLLTHVDKEQLSADEQLAHDRRLLVESRYAQAHAHAQKQLEARAHSGTHVLPQAPET